MPDARISELPLLTDPQGDDWLPVVDVSDGAGVTKRVRLRDVDLARQIGPISAPAGEWTTLDAMPVDDFLSFNWIVFGCDAQDATLKRSTTTVMGVMSGGGWDGTSLGVGEIFSVLDVDQMDGQARLRVKPAVDLSFVLKRDGIRSQ